jgi:hypothetical protein
MVGLLTRPNQLPLPGSTEMKRPVIAQKDGASTDPFPWSLQMVVRGKRAADSDKHQLNVSLL